MAHLLAALLVLAAPSAYAQTAPDPSGHWEGTIEAPGLTAPIEIDLARTPGGILEGTINLPAERINGLPLKVAVEGRSIKLHARADQPIIGTVSEDGRTVAAEFRTAAFSIPFTLTRTGEAHIEPAPKNATVSTILVGTWTGTLALPTAQTRLVLTLVNHPDGSATGAVVNLDQGALEIPVSVITATTSTLTLQMKAIGTTFTGTLTADSNELAGTLIRDQGSVPLTFRRDAADGK